MVEEITEPAETASAQKSREESAGLNAAQYQFLQCLLYGRDYDGLLRAQGVLPSLLVEAINENMFARFGDTVIIYDDGRPALLEDYIRELKRIIQP